MSLYERLHNSPEYKAAQNSTAQTPPPPKPSTPPPSPPTPTVSTNTTNSTTNQSSNSSPYNRIRSHENQRLEVIKNAMQRDPERYKNSDIRGGDNQAWAHNFIMQNGGYKD